MTISDFLVIGDVYILDSQSGVDNKDDKNIDNSLTHQVKSIQSFKNKLKNTVTPGIVHRPTAGELLAKDEPPVVKETHSAMQETLDAIPELREAKKAIEAQGR